MAEGVTGGLNRVFRPARGQGSAREPCNDSRGHSEERSLRPTLHLFPSRQGPAGAEYTIVPASFGVIRAASVGELVQFSNPPISLQPRRHRQAILPRSGIIVQASSTA